jgi:hypothetical protein
LSTHLRLGLPSGFLMVNLWNSSLSSIFRCTLHLSAFLNTSGPNSWTFPRLWAYILRTWSYSSHHASK